MNINIKELFKSDLNPNSSVWWSKDKLDKLNFNFNQFINGGMPGPAGFKGPDGDYGKMGPRGFQGYSGAQGFQGAQGASMPSDWLEVNEKTENGITYPTVLFPLVPPSPPYIEYTPIVMKTGYLNPNSEVGEDYRGAVKTIFTGPLNGVGTTPNKIGLRLQHAGKAADFRLKRTGNFLDMEIGRIVTADAGFDLLNISDEIVYEIVGTSYLKITENLITFGGNLSTTINTQKFISKSALQITQGAIQDYVLISEGSDGKVKWVDKKSVFGSFPIGSIMSIRPSDFNSTNFELNTTITQPGPPYQELRSIYGRGKVNTDFDGWYLCHGEKWKVENGVNEFLTPNLCSFNYDIATNGNGQNLVIGGNNTPILIGGSNISMNAATSGNGNYQVSLSADNSDDTISLGAANPNTNSEVSQMVHIVYLENPTLHWSNTEFTPPPPVSTNITLTSGAVSSEIACSRPPIIVFSWSGVDEAEWGTFNHNTTQRYLYLNNTTNFAPAGWYKNSTGVTRYWNGSAFTQSTQCVSLPVVTANLVTNTNVFQLNGPISNFTGVNYEINAFDFGTCTLMYDLNTGNNPPMGWYRDTLTGFRRYWNGSEFIGNVLTRNYVHLIVKPSFTTVSYIQGCSLTSNIRPAYVETDYSSISDFELYDFVFEEFVIYVHNNWTTGTLGTIPLVNVISQNAPSSTSKFRTMYVITNFGMSGTEHGFEKQYGDIDQSTGILVEAGYC